MRSNLFPPYWCSTQGVVGWSLLSATSGDRSITVTKPPSHPFAILLLSKANCAVHNLLVAALFRFLPLFASEQGPRTLQPFVDCQVQPSGAPTAITPPAPPIGFPAKVAFPPSVVSTSPGRMASIASFPPFQGGVASIATRSGSIPNGGARSLARIAPSVPPQYCDANIAAQSGRPARIAGLPTPGSIPHGLGLTQPLLPPPGVASTATPALIQQPPFNHSSRIEEVGFNFPPLDLWL